MQIFTIIFWFSVFGFILNLIGIVSVATLAIYTNYLVPYHDVVVGWINDMIRNMIFFAAVLAVSFIVFSSV